MESDQQQSQTNIVVFTQQFTLNHPQKDILKMSFTDGGFKVDGKTYRLQDFLNIASKGHYAEYRLRDIRVTITPPEGQEVNIVAYAKISLGCSKHRFDTAITHFRDEYEVAVSLQSTARFSCQLMPWLPVFGNPPYYQSPELRINFTGCVDDLPQRVTAQYVYQFRAHPKTAARSNQQQSKPNGDEVLSGDSSDSSDSDAEHTSTYA